MSLSAATATAPLPFEGALQAGSLLRTYARAICCLVQTEPRERWTSFFNFDPAQDILQFEYMSGLLMDRVAYNKRSLARVGQRRSTVVAERHGFSDLFVPVPDEGGIRRVLVCGPLMRTVPDRKLIEEQWSVMSHRGAFRQEDRLEFARLVLQVPVLNPEVFRGLKHILELTAAVLAEKRPQDDLVQACQELQQGALSEQPCYGLWAANRAGASIFLPVDWPGQQVPGWTVHAGLCDGEPVQALSVAPRSVPGEDALEGLLKIAALRRQAWASTVKVPGVLAISQGDGCTLFLEALGHSAPTEKRSRALVARLEEACGFELCAGQGPVVSDARMLKASYVASRDALYRARLARAAWVAGPSTGAEPQPAGSQEILTALRLAQTQELRGLLERWLNSNRVQCLGDERDAARSIRSLAKEIVDMGFSGRAWAQWAPDFEAGRALDSQELSLIRLALVGAQAPVGQLTQAEKVRQICAYLEAQFGQDESMPDLARRWGLSVSGLNRSFRAELGCTAFAFRARVRLEKAAALLREGRLSVEKIASLCGYPSNTFFSTAFKARFGVPPGRFRVGSLIQPPVTKKRN